MTYWLMKSEPSSFSIEDLANLPNQITHWDGVRNYQVRNMLRDEMNVGDRAFFYHSSTNPPGIVGIVEIIRNGYPDANAFNQQSKYFDPDSNPNNPRWFMVDVKLIQKFPKMITLDELKQQTVLENMLILRKGNRLSITPVTPKEWDEINRLVV